MVYCNNGKTKKIMPGGRRLMENALHFFFKFLTLLRTEKVIGGLWLALQKQKTRGISFRANLPYLFNSLNMIPWVTIFYQLWFRVCRYFRPASKRTETFVQNKYICLSICQTPCLALFSPQNQNSNWKYDVRNAFKYICLNTPYNVLINHFDQN